MPVPVEDAPMPGFMPEPDMLMIEGFVALPAAEQAGGTTAERVTMTSGAADAQRGITVRTDTVAEGL